jgi:hypothetical protein
LGHISLRTHTISRRTARWDQTIDSCCARHSERVIGIQAIGRPWTEQQHNHLPCLCSQPKMARVSSLAVTQDSPRPLALVSCNAANNANNQASPIIFDPSSEQVKKTFQAPLVSKQNARTRQQTAGPPPLGEMKLQTSRSLACAPWVPTQRLSANRKMRNTSAAS